MSDYNEEAYENALIELSQNMGWEHVYGPDIDRDWHSPLYDSVLEDSIRRLNPKAAPSAINEALLKLRNFENAELKKKNALFMDYLQNGLPICLFELKSPSREQTDASEADSMGVPAASGGRAIRGSAIAPLPKGNGCAAATIPNAFLLTKYQYNIGTMHIDIACHQTIQNYQK